MKEQNANTRNLSLDLLRIISMCMIVMLHALSKGGALWDTARFSANWFASWGLEALCLCATNVYVLISGYFLADSNEIKSRKIFRIMGEVWGYSLIIFAVMLAFGYKPVLLETANSAVPFFSKSYWFVNSYILMYILHPYVNTLLDHLGKKEFRRLLIILLIFFSLAQTVTPYLEWTMDESWGYGIIWFECLYLAAVYIRRYGIPPKFTRLRCLAGYIICALAMLACRYVLLRLLMHFNKSEIFADIWFAYNSVPVFLSSIFLFVIFLRTDIRRAGRLISAVAASTLGVYLIHEQGFLRDYLWRDILHLDKWTNTPVQIAMVFLYALIVFSVCLAISIIVKTIINSIRCR